MSLNAINFNPTFSEKTKIRVCSALKTLTHLAEAVSRAFLAALSYILFLTSFGLWVGALGSAERQWHKSISAAHSSKKYFKAIFQPFRSLNISPDLIEPARGLTGPVREHRVRVGADRIRAKLEKEWAMAQEQMRTEEDGAFRYLEGNHGQVEREKIGDMEVGICHFIGRRDEMEDEHLAKEIHIMIGGQIHSGKLFGIFDGHGGKGAARFLKDRLQEKLEEKLEQFNPDELTDAGIWNALKLTFVELNDEFGQRSGSTATVAMILDDKLWTANLGDSRTILQNGDEILQLSQDANPDNERFARGIEHRGGFITDVSGVHRVNGRIAVARSLGDPICHGAMSARPKITQFPLERIRPNSRLILACDGIYDVASTRQVGNGANQNISCTRIAQNIVSSAFEARSRDNLSAMVVNLKDS